MEMLNTEAIFFITLFCLDCKYPGYFDRVRDFPPDRVGSKAKNSHLSEN